MPSDKDYEFARIAVERKLLSQSQADALLADLGAAESLGAGDTFPQMAVKRGLLSEQNAGDLGQWVERSLGQRVEIGGFEIIERIGRGGMGAVFKARQLSMDRVVALKILSRRLAQSRAYVHRFIREARAAAKLNHPNIVQGITVGKSSGYYYFAMEYISGETAAQRLKREGPLLEEDAVAICAQIARALEHAHDRANIIHRDVKPQNILLPPKGPAKLADLGLAREAVQGDTSVTFTGMTLGTPDYISPEQIRGETDLDGRCDIYSLGATLYHLLAGRTPYAGETANVTMARHLTDPVPDLAAAKPGTSAGTVAIVAKAMQKEKAKRYQTAEEMAGALEGVLQQLTSPGAPAPVVRLDYVPRARRIRLPPGSMTAIVLLVAGLIIGVALLALLWSHLREKAPPGDLAKVESPDTEPEDRTKGPPDDLGKVDPIDDFKKKPPKPPPKGRKRGEEAHKRAQGLGRKHKREPWLLIPALKETLGKCRGTEYEGSVNVLLDDAKRELRRMAESKLLAAKTAAERREFDKAVQIMEGVTRWRVPSLTAEAHKLIDTWLAEKKQEEHRANTRRLGARIAYMAKILPALRDRRYAKAEKLAGEAALDKVLGETAKRFKLFEDDIKTLKSLWTEAEQRLRQMAPGAPVRLKSIKRGFVSFKNGIVTAKVEDLVETLALKEMGEVDFFDLLAPYFGAPGRSPVRYMQRGLFYTFDKCQNLEKARKDFAAAGRSGAADAGLRGLSYIEQVVELKPEQTAMELLTEARAAIGQKRWKQAAGKLDALARYRDTEICRRSAAELTELALLAAGRGKGFPHLFSGKATLRGADLVTIVYDLQRKEHRRDWRGGTPTSRGLRVERELRWNAGLEVRSVKLLFNMPRAVDRTELRLMCRAQGDRPVVTARFGMLGGRNYNLEGRRQTSGRAQVRPRTDTELSVVIDRGLAKLSLAGAESLQVLTQGRTPDGQSIFLTAERQPVDVLRVTVSGKLDLGWARRRVADLADIAESTLLGRVDVPADREWAATGITLARGTYYHLKAAGWWKYGPGDSQGTGAGGKPWRRLNMPLYSLVANTGGMLEYVGEEAIIGPNVSGRLTLGMNEVPGQHRDNSGQVTVEVRQLRRRAPAIARGLLGRYYVGTNFERLKNVRVVPNIDFDLIKLARAAGQRDNFSARWEGFLRITRGGLYEFALTSDDGFRLWLDGRNILERWHMNPRNTGKTRPIRLAAGLHRITVEFFQVGGAAHIRLFWRTAGTEGRIIPPGVLFHSPSQARRP